MQQYPLLQTKLYVPALRPSLVPRTGLCKQLDEGLSLGRKLTLVTAPAGFGKTTLLSEWVQKSEWPAAWLSLDESDNELTQFLAYLIAALQTVEDSIGDGVLAALQAPQAPDAEAVMRTLINALTTIPDRIVLVLDDYHLIETQAIHDTLTFLLDHLPPQIHLVIATRLDPPLNVARLRGRGQMTELRQGDLCFTLEEVTWFVNETMGLQLTADQVAALAVRTEGWIVGLQLAALALQGKISKQGLEDVSNFVRSFTGSHRFVLDYLLEEVLHQQSERVQAFLLRTSILDRLCGSLCDAVLDDPFAAGQDTLEHLERANLFVIPLDDERRWYRYHHLFAGLLRQRLRQSATTSPGDTGLDVAELHMRASQWYEDHNLDIEAFHHAVAANDVESAERLLEGKGMPLHFRGAVAPVLNWLASLPTTVLDARPALWVMYASALSMTGQLTGVEHKLQAAEVALQNTEPDDRTRNLVGHIAAIRALLAATQYQAETIIAQSRRALEYLHPDNLPVRTATVWKLGIAYQLQGDRVAARQAYDEAIAMSQSSGNIIINISATIGLGQVQEAENQLHLAAQTYRRVLQLVGDMPLLIVCEAYLGLARVCYEWNDLAGAQQHVQQGIQLARQIENNDWLVVYDLFLARLKFAQGDAASAAAILVETSQSVRHHNFVHRLPEVAAVQVRVLLHQGDLEAAARLAQEHPLHLSQARLHLALGDPGKALEVLERWRQQVETKGWLDERLKVMVLQAIALRAEGEKDEAVQLLVEVLALAEPGGFVRTFVDEDQPMAHLLSEAVSLGIMPDYTRKLLAAFEAEAEQRQDESYLPPTPSAQPLVEPLSPRELEVLQLIAQGLSNREIGERLFIALNTVKGHNRRIYGKLQVKRRTEAVARARELGLL